MKLHIRKAVINDLDFLEELEMDVFPAFQQNLKQNLRKGIKSHFQEVFIVEKTYNGQQALGSICLFKYKHSLRIYSIAIAQKYQNKGIGNELLEFIKDFAIKNNYKNIILEARLKNQKLIKWYESRGFQFVKKIENYYLKDEDAIKMKLSVDKYTFCKNVIIIDQPYKWEENAINAKVISVKEYINNPIYQNNSDFRIYNLCSSYKYQSYGYYVSLLASARGQRIIPNITTIQDLKIANVIQSIAFDLDEFINKSLSGKNPELFSLNIYFGQTLTKGYKNLAKKLYQIFEAPLFEVTFVKNDKWLIKKIKVINFKHITESEKEIVYQFASKHFSKKKHNFPKLIHYKYDVAVLINPEEETPPSNQEALEKFKIAANKKNVYLEFITKTDIGKINEFDALFIRETTNVSHYTYEVSRFAYAEGLVVIDDPWSIMKCSNKIFQHELFQKNKINTPKTIVLAKNSFNSKQLDTFSYPVILKQPDSAFSLGVIKVNNKTEAFEQITKLFSKSDMIICQEFLFSEFDWRIGILDNQALFACKYYMAKNHWQIYNWKNSPGEESGDYESVSISQVPEKILKVAQKAASLIGDGLYGVDLKIVDNQVYVIEVNDNPNIDTDVEDSILKDKLYDKIIDSLVNRIEIAKNTRKISL
ncbi:GNAT family N-acetyltransferase [Marinifilum fragile]|uniref:GNAT family N-acetyltransferase n=1 Tax=Marinifilum fragile TaxID=570161 RepID=UPI0006CFF5E2|nr:GNAT family N-acetyltransferase [Marinifilum fragile]